MKRTAGILVLFAGASAGSVKSLPADGQGLRVALRITAGEGAAAHPVAPGATVRDGDILRLEAAVSKTAHVYVVQTSADRPRERLHPGAEAAPIRAGETLSLPRDSAGYRLEGRPGAETITVLASEGPLCLVAREVADSYRIPCADAALKGAGRGEPPPPPPPQPPVTTGTRGGDLLTTTDPAVVRATAARSGVAVLRFDFHHAP